MKERVRRGWGRVVSVLGLTAVLTGCTPPGPRALLDGERFLLQGKPAEALRRLRTAVEFLPSNAQAWNHLGLALHATRQPGEAADAYQHALQLDRNLAATHFNLGCLYQEQGEFARAADSLRSFVGLQPRATEGWVRLGQVQLRLRQWEPAERSFQSALRQLPGDPEALNGLGVSLQQRRRVNEAWGCFTNVVTRNPSFAPGWLNLAVAAQQSGLKSFAAQAYRHYASLRPEPARSLGVVGNAEQLEALLRPPAPALVPVPVPVPIPVPPTNPPPATTRATNSVAVTPPSSAVTVRTNLAILPPLATSTNAARTGETGAGTESGSAVPPSITHTSAPSVTPPPETKIAVVATNAQVRPPPTPTPTAVLTPALMATQSVVQVIPLVARTNPAMSMVPTNGISVANTVQPAVTLIATSRPPSLVVAPPPVPITPSPTVSVFRPAPAVPAVTSTVPAVEVVKVAPAPRIPTEVRDLTPPPIPLGPGPANPAARPLVRPVGANRNLTQGTDGRGFWQRANPVRWFGDEDGRTEPPPEAVASGAVEMDASGRWRWANPSKWFRGEKGGESIRPPTPVGTGFGSTTNRPMTVAVATPPRSAATNGTGAGVRRPPNAGVGGTVDRGMSTAPVVTEPVREVRRYRYAVPTSPRVGDAKAALDQVELGIQEHRRERLDLAIRYYEAARELDPSSFEALHNLALIRLNRGELPQALRLCEEALAAQPDNAAARFTLALALDRAGYPMDSAAEAERVVRRRADDAAGHLLLANLYSQRLGDPSRARSHYLRVIELQPDHPQSIAIRNWLSDHR